MLTIQGRAIVYQETPLPLWLRVFAIVLGLGLATVIPVPLVIHADWGKLWPTLPLALVFGLVPVAAGVTFLCIGLVSATTLRLDPATGVATRMLRSPLINRVEKFPLGTLATPEVVMREASEDPPFPVLRLGFPGGRAVEMACFSDRAEAESWGDRIVEICRERNPLPP